ncbi:MAG TPA: hypothetical protein VKG05_13810 [Steroidobacteraceae bacterium]|nr:hypothetical protein [Steroidobacteraceae bacterium]
MTDSKSPSRYHGVDRRAPGADRDAPGGSRDGPVNLLKRGEKIGGRHGAITNSLYSWHSYKNWADKMKGSWEEKK